MAGTSSTASTSAVRLTAGRDHTNEFRDLIARQAGGAEAVVESQRKWEKQRDEALGPIVSQAFIQRCKTIENQGKGVMAGKAGQQQQQQLSARQRDCLRLRIADEEWIGEAVKVNRTISSILAFLRTIRRPYLAATSSGAPLRRNDTDAAPDGSDKKPFAAWNGVSSLTDKERDEIEFQVKMTIKRCLARINELEQGEEVRKRTTVSPSNNSFSRIFGVMSSSSGGNAFLGRSHPLYAEQLGQHRAAITQFLGNRLAQANARMGDLQEARLKAQRIKQINLAGSAALTTRNKDGIEQKQAPVAGSVRAEMFDAAGGKGKTKTKSTTNAAMDAALFDEKQTYQTDFSASQLTAEQVQQFDEESSALIKSLTDDLRAVEAAERKLSEISEVQTQLIQHLGNQAELASNLHQEALGHTLEVGKGNEQLKRAKENNRQASRFLCLFLIGSGLGLLFLHCECFERFSLLLSTILT